MRTLEKALSQAQASAYHTGAIVLAGDVMALPRKILNALRAGTYTPSNASKRAREAANRLQQERTRINSVAPSPPRDTFRNVKNQMIRSKHSAYYGTPGYNPSESVRAVENSDEYQAMRQALGLTPDQMSYLASMASKAHAAQARTGDAGELEIYLQYDFLFYHL
jgi:hypothetical protein